MTLTTLTAAVNRRRVLRGLASGPAIVAGLAPQVVRQAFAGQPEPSPFESARHSETAPVFLLETHVAGTAYYQAPTLLPALAVGAPLTLRREPANPYDRMAIEVITTDGAKLGYLPRRDNRPFARMLDAGLPVTAEISALRPEAWDTVRMRLSLGVQTTGRGRWYSPT